MPSSKISLEIDREIKRAVAKHGPLRSAHEAFGVLLEEVDEFWEEVRKRTRQRNKRNTRKELIQIAAIAIRTIQDLKL
jgi:hypothetical protein